MALMPFDKEWPIFPGPRNFFEPFDTWMTPSWSPLSPSSVAGGQSSAMTSWQDFMTPFKEMEERMKLLDRQFSEMSQQMSKKMASIRPPAMGSAMQKDPIITDANGKRKYQLNFDLRQYKPEEIHVKTHNQHLCVHAKHESTDGGNKVYREYQQQMSIPEGIEMQSLCSVLSPDGVLTIEAPMPETSPKAIQQEVPIAIEHE